MKHLMVLPMLLAERVRKARQTAVLTRDVARALRGQIRAQREERATKRPRPALPSRGRAGVSNVNLTARD